MSRYILKSTGELELEKDSLTVDQLEAIIKAAKMFKIDKIYFKTHGNLKEPGSF